MKPTIAEQIAELRGLVQQLLEQQPKPEPLVYTREEAAKALRVSISQLYRLIATGKLWAQPSGITREALHEYLKRPQSKVPAAMSRAKATRTATEEGARLRTLLKAQNRRQRARAT